MSRIRPIDAGLLVLLSLTLGPGPRPAAAEELALIDDIVVNGQRPEEPTAENLSVVVAATGESRPARRGMGLSADDEVRTGVGVQAVLRFLDLDPEVDPLVFVDESSAYQVVDSTTLQGFFGRLFASVSGLFSVITPGGRLGVEGTEFEVLIAPDGAVEIQVLEGVVAFAPGAGREAAPAEGSTRPSPLPQPADPAPAGRAIEIEVLAGDQKTVGMALTVTNGCPATQRFFIDSPAALPWVEIVAVPQPVKVPGGASAAAETEIWVDAAGVEPGLYRDAIMLRCAECDTCSLTRRSVPLVVEVVGPEPQSEPQPEMRSRREELRPSRAGAAEPLRIRSLERLSLGRGARAAAPDRMAERQVVGVLGWTDRVFVAVQPTYAAAGDPPHFDDVDERSRAFRAARYEAVWKKDPTARAKLGNVYKDWGEDRRASKAYRTAAQVDDSLNNSADFVASWADANRRAGRLETAREQAERAVELDPASGRAFVALGNVYRGIARTAADTADADDATLYLERSVEAYKAASQRTDPDGTLGDRRTRGVAETNLAETYTALAKTALAKGETAEADRRLIEAQQAVRAADSAYPKTENPFLLLAEGQVLQERARLAKSRGDADGSSRQLELAQQSYSTALAKHNDLAPASYRIATVYEDRGDTELAEDEYQKSVEKQPTFAPAYDRLGRLKEAESPGSGTAYLDRDRKLMTPNRLIVGPSSSFGREVSVGTAAEPETAAATTAEVSGLVRGSPAEELPRVTVPDLGCQKAKYAADVLAEMGLRYAYSGRGRDVLRLSPKAGSRVDPGTLVTLSLGSCVD